MLTRRQFKKICFLSLLYGLKSCSNLRQPDWNVEASPKSDLFILWERGYLPEENQGILQLIEEWQQITGKKVNLKLVSDDFIEQTLLELLKNPNRVIAPDIIFSITFNPIIAPILAWKDKLIDLSDLIKPIASKFHPNVLSQVFYRNQVRGDRRYYALPVGQSDAYIHYWQDLLAEIGYAATDIPQEWNQFWEFWKTAQTELRSRQYPDLYGLGLCMSASGFDTSAAFQLFLNAYDVTIATHDQGFMLGDSNNRQHLIDVISKFTDFYRKGCVPPDALEWPGSGNNIAFLNHRILMTLNMTLSIPRSQKLEKSKYNRSAAQRYQEIGTLSVYPKTLEGKMLRIPSVINQILVLKHHKQSQDTLDFMQYLLKLDNMEQLMQGFNGRILPTMPQFLNSPLWQDPSDAHSAAALAIYDRSYLLDRDPLHPVLSQIYMQQFWAQIIRKTIQGNEIPVQAADWGIAQIRTIWEGFEKGL